MTDKRMEVFFDVQSDLPRQGPGDDDCTRRALALCYPLPDSSRVLDVGCGPGAQTLVLAEELRRATITAIDVHQPYLEELQTRAVVAGVSDRVTAENMPMEAIAFPPESFDLIWAEGSAYIMGVASAVAAWKRLLAPGGFLALTDLVWLTEDKSVEAVEFFAQEYPAMTDRAGISENVRDAGYELVDHFTLPDSAWWDAYYTPLLARLPALETKYSGDAAALSVIRSAKREVEIRRQFTSLYGYEFFIARNAD